MSGNPYYGTQGYGSGKYGNNPIESLPIGYYLQLLTSEYQPPASPKWNAFLYLLLKKFDDVSQCLVTMDTAWDLDFAVGVQLDTVGVIVGVSRTVLFQPSGGKSPVLDDATYRILLKAKIAQNQWDGKIDSLQGIWRTLFPSGTIVIGDLQNMTADIYIAGSFNSILIDLIENGYIVPRPQGVLYNYILSASLPLFGFDADNAYVAGFDVGKFA